MTAIIGALGSIAGIVGPLLSLAALIFKEFFSAQARAREADEKFELNQATFKKIVDAALAKQLASMAKASADAGNAWDGADGDLKKPSEDSDRGP